jgi:actin-related protein
MLVLPPKFNKNELELITQFCFESLNTPGLYIINRPMATLYGHGSLSGLVIDIGETSTHVNPIMDNSLPEQTIIDANIGVKDLEAHWLALFKADADLNGLLGDKLNEGFVKYFKETILPGLNEIEGETEEDKNKAKEFDYEGLKFTIKEEIFDQMWDALFKPELNSDKCLSLQHSIYNCLQKLDHDRRPLLTDNITFSGCLANVPGKIICTLN